MASTRSNSDSGSSHDGSFFEDWSTDQDELLVEDALAQCDDEVEPIATEEEAAEYEEIRAREEADERELNARFSGERDISSWCKCSNCSLEHITNPQECWCCADIEKCKEKMAQVNPENQCITHHPGFQDVCLNRWVLEIAALGLQTKGHKKYTDLLHQGRRTQHEFLRAVSYRQFVRLVWDFTGSIKRYPLPCCFYTKVRSEFSSANYRGFEEEED